MVLSRSITRRSVFVDSTAYFALVRQQEDQHPQSVLILQLLEQQNWQFFTTPFVLAEVHALIVSRQRRSDVGITFLRSVSGSNSTVVIQPTVADREQALQILERHRDKLFPLVDAISFAVMERMRISYAFTFDRHFAQYGWTILTTELLSI